MHWSWLTIGKKSTQVILNKILPFGWKCGMWKIVLRYFLESFEIERDIVEEIWERLRWICRDIFERLRELKWKRGEILWFLRFERDIL